MPLMNHKIHRNDPRTAPQGTARRVLAAVRRRVWLAAVAAGRAAALPPPVECLEVYHVSER